MITHPTSAELVQAVSRFLAGMGPTLTPREVFMARVAQNALGIVERELALGPAAEAAAAHRLSALLNRDEDYATLNAALCDALREGRIQADAPGLIAALKANLRDQLAIDQPRYAADRP